MSSSLPILTATSSAETELESGFVRPGRWWHADGERIVCDLCPRCCILKAGDRGFCFVRQNIDGQMMLTTYGRSTGFCIDPIEKKPLNHFYPGTSVLSFGTAGCNLGCKFCQNWDISKSREIERLSAEATPEAIAEAAEQLGCASVAFTYNDPVIWAEYAIDTARACHARGIKTVAVTAGYITPEARGEFYQHMDAANVDLKAFTEEFYYRITLSHLQPVLETLEWLKKETDVWFEITNLVIPDANDDLNEIERMCDWILNHVGDDVPVHFTAFHPDFRMRDRGNTPVETLISAREKALQTGLKHVYTGNVDDVRRQSTYCPSCSQVVIERNWYELGKYALSGDRCRYCDGQINGRFATRPGTWGRRRLPVDMRPFAERHPIERIGDSTMNRTTKDRLELSERQSDAVLNATADAVMSAAQGNTPQITGELAGVENVPVAGTFVSLKRRGRLRGCCGSLGSPVPLAKSLESSALRTATNDPRLPPVSAREFPYLDLEVWILSQAEAVAETGTDRVNSVVIGRHGLQVIRGEQRGLLLPGVAVEHGWDAEQFLNQTCVKAGLPPSVWKDDQTTLLRFEGVSISRPLSNADYQPPPPLFSAREFAQYAQHCRSAIDALLTGAVPSYYCPQISDCAVTGVVLTVTSEQQRLTSSRFSWKRTVPLQSTAFSLCEELASAIARNRLSRGEFDVDLLIAYDTTMHGTLADSDLRGISTGSRSLLIIDGQRSTVVFHRDEPAEEVLAEAVAELGMVQPESAQILSCAVQSTGDLIKVVHRPRAVMGGNVRPAAVAGTFYPGDAVSLSQSIDEMIGQAAPREKWSAAMVPHAGWVYSGRLAADVLKRIELPRTIIVIGPKHTPHGVEYAVAPHRIWQFPGGQVESDAKLAQRLAEAVDGWELDAAAHQAEHGTEVEIPLIARLSPETRVIGVALGRASFPQCAHFADGLTRFITELDDPPLLLISSDMNHFATDKENRRLDELALAEMDRLDAEGLYQTVQTRQISMCGVVPAVTVMRTLDQLGRLNVAQRVGYLTSADTTGDVSRVVGYAGMLLR